MDTGTKAFLRGFACALLLAAAAGSATAADGPLPGAPAAPFALAVRPGFAVPVAGDGQIFTPGAAVDLAGLYRLPFFPRVGAGVGLGYALAPLQAVTAVSLISGGAAAGLDWPLVAKLELNAALQAGWYLALAHNGMGTGNNPFLRADVGVSWRLSPQLSVGGGLAYRNYFGFYNDLVLGATANLALGGRPAGMPVRPSPPREIPGREPGAPRKLSGKGVEISSSSMAGVFPVFYKYYASRPLGSITLVNQEKSPVEDLKVSFLVKRYMDNPQPCPAADRIEAGDTLEVPLQGLFTNAITEITESEIVSANVILEYTLKGKPARKELVENVRIHSRNAMVWDDDRKAAAFVTAKDPGVLLFSKNIVSATEGKGSRALNRNLLLAVAVLQGLKEYQASYTRDPTTPYDRLSQDAKAIDFLQFPRETLQYRAGDCDDLSILYCALLESLAVQTAFVTVPGHIYAAVDLGISAQEAAKSFSRADDLVVQDGVVWLPVEVTELKSGFLKAWQSGAKSWRDNVPAGQAALLPVREAWQIYEPVGYIGERVSFELPPDSVIASSYLGEVVRFIEQEMAPREAKLLSEIKANGGAPASVNSLGVLYARFGQYDKAEAQFSRVVAKTDYVPSLINLGNIYYLKAELDKAEGMYVRAGRREADNSVVLLALARIQHDRGSYAAAKDYYARLRKADPSLASRYSYLGEQGEEAARAASAEDSRGVAAWAE
jgi:tetratricopeptide (TPR) repeat protein